MKKNNKGFTLAEMLIVVAIIGVLIAILVPSFTTQLEKARETSDAANIRSAVSECMSNYLAGTTPTSKDVKLSQKTANWQYVTDISGSDPTTTNGLKDAASGVTITVSVGTDGTVSYAKKS